jgi:hypothetical protein
MTTLTFYGGVNEMYEDKLKGVKKICANYGKEGLSWSS